jgi:hypothetical protein
VGKDCNKDEAAAFQHLTESADVQFAQFAQCLRDGCGIEKDEQRSREYSKRSAVRGNGLRQCAFGRCLENGIGLRKICGVQPNILAFSDGTSKMELILKRICVEQLNIIDCRPNRESLSDKRSLVTPLSMAWGLRKMCAAQLNIIDYQHRMGTALDSASLAFASSNIIPQEAQIGDETRVILPSAIIKQPVH